MSVAITPQARRASYSVASRLLAFRTPRAAPARLVQRIRIMQPALQSPPSTLTALRPQCRIRLHTSCATTSRISRARLAMRDHSLQRGRSQCVFAPVEFSGGSDLLDSASPSISRRGMYSQPISKCTSGSTGAPTSHMLVLLCNSSPPMSMPRNDVPARVGRLEVR